MGEIEPNINGMIIPFNPENKWIRKTPKCFTCMNFTLNEPHSISDHIQSILNTILRENIFPTIEEFKSAYNPREEVI